MAGRSGASAAAAERCSTKFAMPPPRIPRSRRSDLQVFGSKPRVNPIDSAQEAQKRRAPRRRGGRQQMEAGVAGRPVAQQQYASRPARRLSTETKSSLKTTEFWAMVAV